MTCASHVWRSLCKLCGVSAAYADQVTGCRHREWETVCIECGEKKK